MITIFLREAVERLYAAGFRLIYLLHATRAISRAFFDFWDL